MKTESGTAIQISEHVVEVRYEPTSTFIDRRGETAARLLQEFGLPHWEINENRTDVFHNETGERVFVSFNNCGYSVRDSNPPDHFSDRAGKLVRLVGSEDILGDPLDVHRIGVRSRFLVPFEGSFGDLMKRYEERYAVLRAEALSDAHLTDIGVTLDLEDGVGKFKTQTGPMQLEAQMRFFMNNREAKYPTAGLYFEVDYRIERHQQIKAGDVAQKVKTMAAAGRKRFENIKALILR